MTVIIVFPLKPSALSLLILYACGAQESVASVWLSSHNRQRKSDKNTKVFYDPLLILASCSAEHHLRLLIIPNFIFFALRRLDSKAKEWIYKSSPEKLSFRLLYET